MASALEQSSIIIPPEVSTFAAEQGVRAVLPAVLEMTRRLFPHAEMGATVEEDPEIANDRHIVVVVKAKGMPVPEALEKRWQWHRGLFACCPAPLVSTFCLGLEIG